MGDVTPISKKQKHKKAPNAMRAFLNKPMSEMTIGDSLALHGASVLVSLTLRASWEGWMYLTQDFLFNRRRRS